MRTLTCRQANSKARVGSGCGGASSLNSIEAFGPRVPPTISCSELSCTGFLVRRLMLLSALRRESDIKSGSWVAWCPKASGCTVRAERSSSRSALWLLHTAQARTIRFQLAWRLPVGTKCRARTCSFVEACSPKLAAQYTHVALLRMVGCDGPTVCTSSRATLSLLVASSPLTDLQFCCAAKVVVASEGRELVDCNI